jgi:hypothetical protein
LFIHLYHSRPQRRQNFIKASWKYAAILSLKAVIDTYTHCRQSKQVSSFNIKTPVPVVGILYTSNHSNAGMNASIEGGETKPVELNPEKKKKRADPIRDKPK